MILQLIQELKSLLFANKLSINTNSFVQSKFNSIYLILRPKFSICHLICLFNATMSLSEGSWCQAAIDKSKVASSQHIIAIYAPRARYSLYQSLRVAEFGFTSRSFFPQSFYSSIIELSFYQNIHPLNIKGLLYKSYSVGFAVNLAFISSLFSKCLNLQSLKIRVLSVCIPITPKAFYIVVTKRHGSYNNVIIYSFSR